MNGNFSDVVKPAWYELSLLTDSKIQLRIHSTAFQQILNMDWSEVPMVPHLVKTLDLPEFVAPCIGDCGFGGILKYQDSGRHDWIAWDFDLPNIKANFEDRSEKKNQTLALRATLHLIFIGLWLFEGEVMGDQSQLLVVEGVCLPDKGRSYGGGALSVSLLPPLVQWLATTQRDGSEITEVSSAMHKASMLMWPEALVPLEPSRFRASFRSSKWVNLDIPGDSCGLDPGDYGDESLESGYTLQSHNVDTSLQQLTLLAGLARLHDLARA